MPRVTKEDLNSIAEYVYEEYKRRKKKRKDLEKQWEDIDRQLRMEPDTAHKRDANGNVDRKKAWMPEMELPLQAQTLEIQVADARRMLFPTAGPWAAPHAALTDDYLEKVDFSAIIAGDKNEVPTLIDQDAADKLVSGVMSHWERQYNFHDNIDMINAEAFKYGMGVGRGRLATKQVFMSTAKGVKKETQKIPVIFPRSIKHCYPDDRESVLMNEGFLAGPLELSESTRRLEDLKKEARETDGWITSGLKDLKPDKNGNVKLIEAEGDFVISRKTVDSIMVNNRIMTVAVGDSNPRVIKEKKRDFPFSSYIYFPYHIEHLDTPYPTSPLMKGRPIQIAAVDALNRLIMTGALNAQPPVKFDKDNPEFASTGGPLVFPGAQWPDANVSTEQIGDPSALFNVYIGLLQQYADVTGVNAPRLGAQTNSHTTAYAKEAELSRGTIRTVDYVRSMLDGPLSKWLHMAYQMGREAMKNDTIYIDAYQGFVDIGKSELPEKVIFEAFGAGGPAEEQAKRQERIQAVASAMQMDQLNVQMGGQPVLDLKSMIEQTLREGGWTDVDRFLQGTTEIPSVGPNLAGTPGLVGETPTQI